MLNLVTFLIKMSHTDNLKSNDILFEDNHLLLINLVNIVDGQANIRGGSG